MKKTSCKYLAIVCLLCLGTGCGPDKSANDKDGGAKKTGRSLDPDTDPDHKTRWTDSTTIPKSKP